MIKNLDKDKEKSILGSLVGIMPISEIIKSSRVADKTARIYVARLVELGKIEKLQTYPITYKRIPRKEWPENNADSTDKDLIPQAAMEIQIAEQLVSSKELENPILNAVQISLSQIGEGGLTHNALAKFIAETANAVYRIGKEQ